MNGSIGVESMTSPAPSGRPKLMLTTRIGGTTVFRWDTTQSNPANTSDSKPVMSAASTFTQ
jgi:hypothetical protein